MKSWMFGLSLIVILVCPSWAQAPPPPEIERVPFVPANKVDPTLSVETSLVGDEFIYRYTLANGPSAEQPVNSFTITHAGSSVSFNDPRPWVEFMRGDAFNLSGKPTFGWVPHRVEQMIQPGQSFGGFECRSDSLPGCTFAYIKGDVPLLREDQNYANPEDVLPELEDNLKIPAIAPMIPPASVDTPEKLGAELEKHWQTAQELGWLPTSGAFSQAMSDLILALKGGNSTRISSATQALATRLGSEEVNPNGMALVRPSVAYVAKLYPPPRPSSQTLPASKDSILSQQNPNRNEGANDLLRLSHRPEEKNKSNNPIVAFDLSGVDLSGLTRARLVLNVQECEQPRKWGPEGRKVLAYPVNEEWVEGNGETFKAGSEEKTRGTG